MSLATAAEQQLLQAKDISKLDLKSEDGGGTGGFCNVQPVEGSQGKGALSFDFRRGRAKLNKVDRIRIV